MKIDQRKFSIPFTLSVGISIASECCSKGIALAKISSSCQDVNNAEVGLTNIEKMNVICLKSFKSCCEYASTLQCQFGINTARFV